jgi:hypothetical protein
MVDTLSGLWLNDGMTTTRYARPVRRPSLSSLQERLSSACSNLAMLSEMQEVALRHDNAEWIDRLNRNLDEWEQEIDIVTSEAVAAGFTPEDFDA